MEDQLRATDAQGVKEGVEVIPYKAVLEKGLNSDKGKSGASQHYWFSCKVWNFI
jgi:hypothetical protein